MHLPWRPMIKNFLSFCAISILTMESLVCMAAELHLKTDLTTNPPNIAEQNILSLDFQMMGIYDKSQKVYRKEFLSQHPVILALFNISGGDLILYLPGKESLKAPPVSNLYQILKSISHSSLAVFQLADFHLNNPDDTSWLESMKNYQTSIKSSIDGLSTLNLDKNTEENLQKVLKRDIQFLDMCLSKGNFTKEDLQQYIQEVKPFLKKNIQQSASIQVRHWMQVMKEWKELLGSDWDKTYGVSDTVYMLRQNNVLFSVLAQFFGKAALNDRLFLFETTDFRITSEQILDLLIRTVSDRTISYAFFGNYYLMDNDITGGDARNAIQEVGEKLGLSVFLPPEVPFHSTEWPWRIDPHQGEGAGNIHQTK